MGAPSAIDSLLVAARRDLVRVQPADLADEQVSGALVVDIRPCEQRQRDGDLPGAIVVDRNVLEWRLDPSCPHHLPEMKAADRRIILVCNEGYSSSLAAATLRQLGLLHATDLVGGFQAYQAWLDLPARDQSRTSQARQSTPASAGSRQLQVAGDSTVLTGNPDRTHSG
jgi:rhodanese-related sulfurtransferase